MAPIPQLCGAERRYVKLYEPDWTFDPEELRRAFNSRTKAIILNSPNNPTGKVFTRRRIGVHRRPVPGVRRTGHHRRDLRAHSLRWAHVHIPIMSLPGMRERSILVNSMSKTYSVTGWRVGWVLAPPDLTDSIRKVHDFLTVGAAAPLQQAGAMALAMPDSYYPICRRNMRSAATSGKFAGGRRISLFQSSGGLLRNDGYFRLSALMMTLPLCVI